MWDGALATRVNGIRQDLVECIPHSYLATVARCHQLFHEMAVGAINCSVRNRPTREREERGGREEETRKEERRGKRRVERREREKRRE